MKINGVTISGGGSAPTVLSSQLLSSTGWSLNGGYYVYTFSNGAFTANSIVTFVPDNASVLTVSNCQMLPAILSSNGNCRLSAMFPPGADITGDFIIQ